MLFSSGRLLCNGDGSPSPCLSLHVSLLFFFPLKHCKPTEIVAETNEQCPYTAVMQTMSAALFRSSDTSSKDLTWYRFVKKKKNLQLAYFMWKKSKIIAMCLYIRQELADYICSALLPLIRDIWSILLMVPPPLRFLCCLHILLMYLVSCVLINQHCS